MFSRERTPINLFDFCMGIFGTDKLYTEKEMRWENMKHSGVMKKLLSNKTIAGALDQWSEQRELYTLLRSKAEGGITRAEMRQILGKLRQGGGKTIDRMEAMKIAHELFPGRFTERYDFSPERTATTGTASYFQAKKPEMSPGMSSVDLQKKVLGSSSAFRPTTSPPPAPPKPAPRSFPTRPSF